MKQLAALLFALLIASCTSAPERVATAGGDPMRPAGSYAMRNIPAPQKTIPLADYLIVDKTKRMLVAYSGGKPIRAYRGLQFGDAPKGHKRFQGDERTPEGVYRIDWRNPQSRFHLSLRISYPNERDRAYASQYGLSPGGDIFIHGQPNGLDYGRMSGDWTDGCIALSNEEIEELWQIVPNGTPIEIRP
ncbi:L,D-transpeptidase family protein [Erythrobacter sp. SCSIO 43205]|uniref:L,D-transpeptidase family protein n=1 Tax=Erythrobacter sp. SCSIO 43205 TaxID=2779361 RepID=UPI001CA911B4|nr:L,D-transpeptidase family protein [Erythrobacter sp. SCSIO 43205]UAB79387.1 L,D-transpeptidase family protein [Erythrobacter sp. SCSIO 43205]